MLDLKHMHWLTEARLRRYALIWAIAAIVILAYVLYSRTSMGLTDEHGMVFGTDFVPFWGGGHLAAQGELERAYDFWAFKVFHDDLLGREDLAYKFDYPPIAALLLIPFGLLPYMPGFFLWAGLGVAACAAGLRTVVANWRTALLGALATPAMFLNLVLGQNAGFTAGLLGGGLSLLQRRPVLAGVLIGLLSFKPQLAVLVPFALAAAGLWRSFFAAAATVGALVWASFAVFGVSGWEAFIEHSVVNSRLMLGEEMYVWPHMISVFISLRYLGVGGELASGIQMAAALAMVVLVVVVWRRDAPLPLKNCVLVIASFFVTPYLHVYDLTVLAFVIAWRASLTAAHPFLPWEKLTLGIALLLPLFNAQLIKLAGLPVGPVILLILLIFQTRAALSPGSAGQSKGTSPEGPAPF